MEKKLDSLTRKDSRVATENKEQGKPSASESNICCRKNRTYCQGIYGPNIKLESEGGRAGKRQALGVVGHTPESPVRIAKPMQIHTIIPSSSYFVQCLIKDIPMTAMGDTGSTPNIVSSRAWQKVDQS